MSSPHRSSRFESRFGVHSAGLLLLEETDRHDISRLIGAAQAELARVALRLGEVRALPDAVPGSGKPVELEGALLELLGRHDLVVVTARDGVRPLDDIDLPSSASRRLLIVDGEAERSELRDRLERALADGALADSAVADAPIGVPVAVCTLYGVPSVQLRAASRRLLGSEEGSDWWCEGSPYATRLVFAGDARRQRSRATGHDVAGDRWSATGLVEALGAAFGPERVTAGSEPLAVTVIEEARRLGVTVAAAESCTGGRVAAEITSVPGGSEVFWGSLVTYAYEAKRAVLGVDAEVLERHGAVSEVVVRQMAAGVRRVSGADLSVAISGVAGPAGGTPEKPVGTVWIACDSDRAGTQTRLLRLGGGRERIQRDSVRESLVLLRALLNSG